MKTWHLFISGGFNLLKTYTCMARCVSFKGAVHHFGQRPSSLRSYRAFNYQWLLTALLLYVFKYPMHKPTTPSFSRGRVVTCTFITLWNNNVSFGDRCFSGTSKFHIYLLSAAEWRLVKTIPTSDQGGFCGKRWRFISNQKKTPQHYLFEPKTGKYLRWHCVTPPSGLL